MRDVADLHIRAMTHPDAKGQRFLAVAGKCVSMFDVAQMLRRRLGEAAARVPRREIPDWQMRVAALLIRKHARRCPISARCGTPATQRQAACYAGHPALPRRRSLPRQKA